ncbi:MAG: BlaI/MecI/CopY family transcriptional regulator [Ruminococcaceae bacterium]|nr:BlaI/MecI/CopY family transcriptional regulator [Oscillospiraceae bacterium]
MEKKRYNSLADEYLIKLEEVDYSIRLPDTEFEVMKAVWDCDPPATTGNLMDMIGEGKGWKAPTLISFLNRLEEKGFIMSYKTGKNRNYIPLADRDFYLTKISQDFIDRYHDGSFVNVLSSYFSDKVFTSDDVDEILGWIKARFETDENE